MSAKRGDFLSGLRAVKEENAVVRPVEPKSPPVSQDEALPARQDNAGRSGAVSAPPVARQKGREGKVSITQWVDPVVRKQIAQISLDEDKDQYELINEALNLLFEKYGRSTIA